MEDKPNYYAIIPAEVRYDTELKDKAKLLYGEIAALSNKDGYCWATNNYFADLYEVNKNTISRLIQELADKKYIEVEIKYKEGTKEIEGRYIKIGIYPYLQNCGYPIYKNVEENNTSINNNINNIYKHFENIFVRTLNGIEAQMIESWLKDKTEEQIINAINECAKSNIDNLKYIEKVLYGKKKNKSTTPEWFDKEIKSETSSDEEIKDFKEFITDFRKE